MDAPNLFDRRLRRLRRDRAAARIGHADYLHRRVAAELIDRLDFVTRRFEEALLLGTLGYPLVAELERRRIACLAVDPGYSAAQAAGGIQAEEDHLPIADDKVDLAIALGTLDSVDDLPGALILLRRALRPGGMLIGAIPGAGSLPRLRAAMAAADEAQGGGAAARIHPQIDVRGLGDLLLRAGFQQPVVDQDGIDIRFASLDALVRDLRAMGATNCLAARSRVPIGRRGLAAARAAFAADAGEDGRTAERIELLYFIGWSG